MGFSLKGLVKGVYDDLNLWDGGKSHGNPQGKARPQPASTSQPNVAQRAWNQVNPFDNGRTFDNPNPVNKKSLWEQGIEALPDFNEAVGGAARAIIPGLKELKDVQENAKKGLQSPLINEARNNPNVPQFAKDYINFAEQNVKPIDYGQKINDVGEAVINTPVAGFSLRNTLGRVPGVEPVAGFVNENIIQPGLQTTSRVSLAGQGDTPYDEGMAGFGQVLQDAVNIGTTFYAPAKGASLGARVLANAVPGVAMSTGQDLAEGNRDVVDIAKNAALSGLATATFGEGVRGVGKVASKVAGVVGDVIDNVRPTRKVTTSLVPPKPVAPTTSLVQPREVNGRFGVKPQVEAPTALPSVPKKGILPEPPILAELRNTADNLTRSRESLLAQGFPETHPSVKANDEAYASAIREMRRLREGGYAKIPGKKNKLPDSIEVSPKDTFYHGTSSKDADSIVKNGFNPKLSQKGELTESPYALFASKATNQDGGKVASLYGDTTIEIKPKADAKILNADSETWLSTMGKSKGAADSARYADQLKKAGYDGILDANGEIAVLNPDKFTLKKTTPVKEQVPIARSFDAYLKNEDGFAKLPSKKATIDPLTQPSLPGTDQPVSTSKFDKTLKAKGYDLGDIPGYQRLPNEDVIAKAQASIDANENEVITKLLARNPKVAPTPLENAQSITLLQKLVREGRDDQAAAIAKATASSSREAGRAVQILARLEAVTPEGALVRAQRIIQEYNDKVSKEAKKLVLSPENQTMITKLADDVQAVEQGTRARDLAEGKLLKYIEDLVPASALKKISSAQTMAQLLNPKTAIRNVVGNALLSGIEDVSTVPATVADAVISAIRGTGRTTTVANPLVKAKGAARGLKYGIEDVSLGIKTSGITGKFDIQPNTFKKGIMAKAEKLLGYELGAADKAFYQGQFDSSLDNIMRAQGVKKPTLDMVEIANAEALYATFQNNSTLASGLQKIKGLLNMGKDWGVGDIVLKYPRTPGNIVQVGLDYSPAGVFKAATTLYKNWENLSASAQRSAARDIGRSLTGTGIISLGAILASNKIITGQQNPDKDMAKLEREAGQGPFSINMTALGRFLSGEDSKPQKGDITVNYDWLQPTAIALSMGANMVLNQGKKTEDKINTAWESVAASTDTIMDQPVLKGVGDFVKTTFEGRERGGGLGKALSNAAAGTPAGFVPSFVNQISQLGDNTARETRDPKFVDQVTNMIKARIPGFRNTLAPSVTSLGEDRQAYDDGKNTLFNVFLNPAFVKTYSDSEVVNLVRDINDRSGETQQVPRSAMRSIKINGEQVKLDTNQFSSYQKYIGTRTNEAFSQLAQNPGFMALPDEEKAKRMSDIMTDINTAAKVELFGNNPSKLSSGARQVLAGGTLSGTSATAGSPKEKYEEALRTYEADKKSGAISAVNSKKREKEITRLKAQANYSRDSVDLYSQSFKDIVAFVNSNENGKALWDEVQKLDKSMVDAGFASKLYNKNGSLKAISSGGKGKSKGRKKGGTRVNYANYLVDGSSNVAAIRNLVKKPKIKRKAIKA